MPRIGAARWVLSVTALVTMCASAAATSAHAQGGTPSFSVALSETVFQPGSTMTLNATLAAGAGSSPVDAYVVVQLPTGQYLSLQLGGGFVPGIVPIARGFVPFAYDAPLGQYTFNGSEPTGTYLWHFGLTQPGTLELIGVPQQVAFTFSHSTPSLTKVNLSAALRAGELDAASKLTGNAALEGLREVDQTAKIAIAEALGTCTVIASTPEYEVCATSGGQFRFFLMKDDDGVWRVIVW